MEEAPVPPHVRTYILTIVNRDRSLLQRPAVQQMLGVTNAQEAIDLVNRVNLDTIRQKQNTIPDLEYDIENGVNRNPAMLEAIGVRTPQEALNLIFDRNEEMAQREAHRRFPQLGPYVPRQRANPLFVNTPKKSAYTGVETECAICTFPLTEPSQYATDGKVNVAVVETEAGSDPVKCGHKFHKECLQEHIRTRTQQRVTPLCPIDNAKILHYYPLSTEGGRRKRRKTRKVRKTHKARNVRKTRR